LHFEEFPPSDEVLSSIGTIRMAIPRMSYTKEARTRCDLGETSEGKETSIQPMDEAKRLEMVEISILPIWKNRMISGGADGGMNSRCYVMRRAAWAGISTG
jgi:hypothetical protein